MTSQGSASGRFTRAIQQRNLLAAEIALREMGTPSLLVALEYVILLAELQPDKAKVAALRWHGRLELEARTLTLAESQFALAALAALCAGERDAIGVLRRLHRKVRPTMPPRVG
jgi:predicted PhzF superfamily epimerase YddE/YHI9